MYINTVVIMTVIDGYWSVRYVKWDNTNSDTVKLHLLCVLNILPYNYKKLYKGVNYIECTMLCKYSKQLQ